MKKKPSAKRWLWEFSKRVVVVMAVLYFISLVYAMTACYNAVSITADATALAALISETNETFRVVIGGYLIKAGVENATKIIKTQPEQDDCVG